MYALRKNITITAVDIDRLVGTSKIFIMREISQKMIDLIANEELTIPITVYLYNYNKYT